MCWLLALAIKGWSVPSKGPSRPRGSLGTSCCCLRGGRKRNVCCPHGPDKLQKTGEWTDCPTETKLHHCGTEQVSCSFLFLLFVSENVEEAQSKCENRLKRSTFKWPPTALNSPSVPAEVSSLCNNWLYHHLLKYPVELRVCVCLCSWLMNRKRVTSANHKLSLLLNWISFLVFQTHMKLCCASTLRPPPGTRRMSGPKPPSASSTHR